MSHLYIDAINKKEVDRTPIWIMRQAGRYLPEYREFRDKYDFKTLCKTPELATEITLQPIRRFNFDAAILFSDILVVPEAMGLRLKFIDARGPELSPPVLNEDHVNKLSVDQIESNLDYVPKAIELIQHELNDTIPLIGFSASPFTLAVYMVEGKTTRNFKFIKNMLYSKPQVLHNLLVLLTKALKIYLTMQIRAGVNAIQIFDTWGGILPPHLFERFSVYYIKQIVSELKQYNVPVTVFSRGGMDTISLLTQCNADMLSIDWTINFAVAKEKLSKNVALQGNLDPTVLYGEKSIIKDEISRILNVYKNEGGHVFNLGHGILPDIPVDNVYFLVEEVNSQSSTLRKKKE